MHRARSVRAARPLRALFFTGRRTSVSDSPGNSRFWPMMASRKRWHMDLFTSKAVLWRRRIQNDNASRLAYQQLAATIGEPQAKEFLEIVYHWWVKRQGWEIDALEPQRVALNMRHERETYHNRMQYVNSLLPQANDGTLGGILNAHLLKDDDFYRHP